MSRNSMKKMLPLILCIVLIAAMALFATGCTGSKTETPTEVPISATVSDGDVLGEGGTVFTVVTVDLEDKETTFEVHTDAETVGAALLELGVIDGEDGDYGLYIKTVNGLTLDWDTDGKYWAFYINGEYALTGVDQTEVTAGTTYSFRPE
ncbi:MAG: DUF4430 domain-containing protein [Oscillospiraceae bacterium]|nr:DUF4430 domain-containing protein [Oscillospiraceae bacterium]